VKINAARFLAGFETLETMTVDPPYTRRAFTAPYQQARDWLRAQLLEAGLSVRLDAGANLIGRLEGGASTRALVSGSHLDTVVGGGRFDGILGVLAALEVARTLHDHGSRLEHALEVVDFLSEEPSDYGASCVGSRAWAGTLTPAMLEATNAQGETLAAAMVRAGGDPRALNVPLRTPSELAGYVELHIEQGRILEAAGAEIGAVTGIVAIQRHDLIWRGRADHAGTTPMNLRADAFVAASRFAVALRDLARGETGLVATVGRVAVRPNNANVVPGEVALTFEARCLEEPRLQAFTARALEFARKIALEEGIALDARLVSGAAPMQSDPRIVHAVQASSRDLGLHSLELPSGAGHDAMHVSKLCPAGMVFVPCKDGRSHDAQEFTTPDQRVRGAQVLLETLVRMDQAL
jgi:N-carbamoyl-L-amino-acid hydrolase